MVIKIRKELYSRQSVFKAAYHFTDRCYLFVDADETSYMITITPKDGYEDVLLQEQFQNELIAQAAREEVARSTKTIRELILGRAFASTIVEEEPAETEETADEDDPDLFEDWYQRGK